MKSIIYLFVITLFSISSYCQNDIKGEILYTYDNLKVIKLSGTHYERGYAYGYLMGDNILEIYNNYIRPSFGNSTKQIKNVIKGGKLITIDEKYQAEAKGIIAGMDAAGIKHPEFDYLDILIENSFLDILGLFKKSTEGKGCSTLISWGDATINSELNGGSVITRHLDWSSDPVLVKNQVIVIHTPSEEDEQPWLMVGFAGQMSVLSGCNDKGLGVFQNMLYSYNSGYPDRRNQYDPIWFSLREALENRDPNSDGKNDVNDISYVLKQNKNGYSNSYIISSIASAKNNRPDSLVASIIELTPEDPKITIRRSNDNKQLSEDILYAANSAICRENERNYCPRYNNVIKALKAQENISPENSWDIMKSFSTLPGNIQFMQYIPEKQILKLSVYKNVKDAHLNEPYEFMLDELFE